MAEALVILAAMRVRPPSAGLRSDAGKSARVRGEEGSRAVRRSVDVPWTEWHVLVGVMLTAGVFRVRVLNIQCRLQVMGAPLMLLLPLLSLQLPRPSSFCRNPLARPSSSMPNPPWALANSSQEAGSHGVVGFPRRVL